MLVRTDSLLKPRTPIFVEHDIDNFDHILLDILRDCVASQARQEVPEPDKATCSKVEPPLFPSMSQEAGHCLGEVIVRLSGRH